MSQRNPACHSPSCGQSRSAVGVMLPVGLHALRLHPCSAITSRIESRRAGAGAAGVSAARSAGVRTAAGASAARAGAGCRRAGAGAAVARSIRSTAAGAAVAWSPVVPVAPVRITAAGAGVRAGIMAGCRAGIGAGAGITAGAGVGTGSRPVPHTGGPHMRKRAFLHGHASLAPLKCAPPHALSNIHPHPLLSPSPSGEV